MTDIKKYIPFIIIGVVVIYLVMKLVKSGSDSQVVNRVIPVQGENNEVALKQIDAQFALGKLQADAQSQLAQASITAENNRLAYQNKALELTSQTQLKALDIQSQRDQNLAAIARDSSIADANIRFNAAQELQRQNKISQLQNSLLGSAVSSILQAIRGQQQRAQSSGGSPTSAGSGLPAGQTARTTRTSSALQRALAAFRGTSYPIENVSLAGQYADYLDLQPYYQNEVNAYDNWLNYFPSGISYAEPVGSVTSSYELFDPNYISDADLNYALFGE